MASRRSRFPWMSFALLVALVVAVYQFRDEFEGIEGMVPSISTERNLETSCSENLVTIGEVYYEWRRGHSGETPRSGPGFLIEMRRRHYIPMGHENVLLCPDDAFAIYPAMPDQRARYDSADPDDLDDFAGMVSYAFRDSEHFPISSDPDKDPILAACRCGPDGATPHHSGGLYVLYATGRVAFRPWELLGLRPFMGTLVGPGSANEQLAKLIVPR